jgi:iron complex outermembrane receptor protein
MGQGGFRTDWQVNKADQLTLQGDYYRLQSDLDFSSRFVSLSVGSMPYQGPNHQEGANVLTRWTRTMEDSSSFQLQMYYDHLKRKSGVPFDNVVDQFDIDFQHNLLFAEVHNFSWGLNYRFINYDLETTSIIRNTRKNSNLASLFLHDEIQLVPKKLSLILGLKTEYNSFTDFEYQPSVRTAWNPNPNHTFWAAFSRAVRLPTVSDQDITVNEFLDPFTLAPLIQQIPNSGAKSEELLAYELGYRAKIGKKLNFDLTGYYYDYDNLLESNFANFIFVFPTVQNINDNSVKGKVYGVELSAQWQVRRNWRLAGSYSYAKIELDPFPGAPIDPFQFNSEGQLEAELEPHHIFNIRSNLNLPHNLEFDTFYYYVSDRSSKNIQNAFQSIPEYGRLDVRLGWKPVKNVDLSFVAQNLLDPAHPEISEVVEVNSETPRSFFLKATLKF